MKRKWEIQICKNWWFSLGFHVDHTDPSITLHFPGAIFYIGNCKQPGFKKLQPLPVEKEILDQLPSEERQGLVDLSIETRNLINEGVYSLYSIKDGVDLSKSKYILYTSKRSFLLNETGGVLKEKSPNFQISVDQAITFIDNEAKDLSDSWKNFQPKVPLSFVVAARKAIKAKNS